MMQQDIRSFFKKKKPEPAEGTSESDTVAKNLAPAKEPSAKEVKKQLKELEKKCIVETAGDMPPVSVFALPPMFRSTTMSKDAKISTSNDSLEEEGMGGEKTIKTRAPLEIRTIDLVDENGDELPREKEGVRNGKKRKKPPEWTKSTKKGNNDPIHEQSRRVKVLKKQIASYQFLNCQEEVLMLLHWRYHVNE